MNILIIYVIVATIFESVELYFGRKQFLKATKKHPEVLMIVDAIMKTENFKVIKQKAWNWYTIIFVATPMFIILSQFVFPVSIFSKVRKLIFGKTKLEKQAELETKQMDEYKKKQEEWMKNEGALNPEVEHIEIIEQPDIAIEDNGAIIKDGRIVSDTTFATRFVSFVKDIQVNDACSYDEKDYMVLVAGELLEHQIKTVTDKDELDYLKRCHPEMFK